MNNNSNPTFGNPMAMPSGSEVESAAFHPPVTGEVHSHSFHAHVAHCGCAQTKTPTMRDRVDDLKQRGMEKLQQWRYQAMEMTDQAKRRGNVMKWKMQRTVNTKVHAARDNSQMQWTRMQDSMKTNPTKWAGIAAGAGFGIGLIGRYLHWRNNHRVSTHPHLVVIERGC